MNRSQAISPDPFASSALDLDRRHTEAPLCGQPLQSLSPTLPPLACSSSTVSTVSLAVRARSHTLPFWPTQSSGEVLNAPDPTPGNNLSSLSKVLAKPIKDEAVDSCHHVDLCTHALHATSHQALSSRSTATSLAGLTWKTLRCSQSRLQEAPRTA